MSPDPADRFATATELASAVEAFLDGVRRREEAGRHVDAAREAWQRYGELGLELERWHRTVREQEATVPRWASLDQKRALHGARRRIRDLGPQRARAFAELVAACERALSHDPGHDPARELMAEAWFGRLREGEARRDVEAVDYAEERVRAYDDHRFAALLQGTGALTLETTPDGAEVFAQRFDTRPLIWTLDPPRPLGRTPLSEAPLEMGSYLLTIRAPGRRDTRYPVRIDRGAHWQGGAPLPLLSEADIGHGFLYVPGGPFLCGGDEQAGDCTARDERPVPGFLLARYPVTVRDYCRFLDALHGDDPDAAWARVPRTEVGATGDSGRAWSRPDAGGRYDDEHLRGQLEQDEWSWPVAGISWEDARACAGWLHPGGRLPTEHEWEKAARGVDGRAFPWGDHFDSSLCKMRDSRQGRPRPEPVGVFEPDRSVFGVRDLAGGIREWCGDTSYGPDATRRPIRGGSWFAYARFCRSAHRNGHEPWFVHSNHGFRVALPLAGEVSEP
jgi:serine/threonine-protein kinase